MRGLDPFFKPRSVAVIGATERPAHVGRAILWNLISSPFGGTVYPVNSKRAAVLGIRAYHSIGQVPEQVELAVVITPAASVPSLIRRCADAGVPGAVIISAGFRERGDHGIRLEQEVLETARKGNMRLIGPNCLGIMCPITGFNATFAPAIARPGSVALISQSGAICTALFDWSLREHVGFSRFSFHRLDVTRMCFIDYDRQMAFVAERSALDSSPGEIIGVGRLIKSPLQNEAEVAAVVSDSFHRKGVARALVSRLVGFARDEKLGSLRASVPGRQSSQAEAS